MHIELGPRDQQRYGQLHAGEREYLLFLVRFGLRILERRPRQVECLECLAAAFTALGYYQDGLRLDRRLQQLFPNHPTILYNLACSLALTGRSEEALTVLERAMEAGYDDAEHMSRDLDLLNLHDHERFRQLLRRLRAGARSPA